MQATDLHIGQAGLYITEAGLEGFSGPASASLRGVELRVRSKGPKNIVLDRVDGGRGVRLTPNHLTTQAPERNTLTRVAIVEPPFDQGTVVQIRGRAGLYVITGSTGDKMRAFPINGDTRYVRNLTRAAATKVDVKSMTDTEGTYYPV